MVDEALDKSVADMTAEDLERWGPFLENHRLALLSIAGGLGPADWKRELEAAATDPDRPASEAAKAEAAMDALGVHTLIRSLVRSIWGKQPLVLHELSDQPYIGFMAEDNTQIALYVNKSVVDLALDPIVARAHADRLGLRVVKP